MLPHFQSLLDAAQSAVHALHSVDGRDLSLPKESFWTVGDELQATIDEAKRSESVASGEALDLPDFFGEALKTLRPFSNREAALEMSAAHAYELERLHRSY